MASWAASCSVLDVPLGETVAVLLILSQTNVIHLNILGPGGGQIPAAHRQQLRVRQLAGKERLDGFRATPLHHHFGDQLQRSPRRRTTSDCNAMMMLQTRTEGRAISSDAPASAITIDKPRRQRRWAPGAGWEFLGSLVAAGCVVMVAFQFSSSRPLEGMITCWCFGFALIYGGLTRLLHGVRIAKDRLATVGIIVGAAIALFPLLEIIESVVAQGAPVVFAHFPAFLVHDMSTAAPSDPVWKGGMGHAIVGTFEQVGLATLFTVPIAVLTATFLSETSNAFARLVRTIVDCMMGTPSIIAGIFVYLFWVEPKGSSGFSGFAASIALAILMLPIMIRTAEEVLRVVPGSLREAALALGSPRWRVSLRVVLPTARSGLLTAVILGVALAVGETAPALLTAHGSPRYNFNPFTGPQAEPSAPIVPDDLEPERQSGSRRVGRSIHLGLDCPRPLRCRASSRFIETRSSPSLVTAKSPQGGRPLLTSSRLHPFKRAPGFIVVAIVGAVADRCCPGMGRRLSRWRWTESPSRRRPPQPWCLRPQRPRCRLQARSPCQQCRHRPRHRWLWPGRPYHREAPSSSRLIRARRSLARDPRSPDPKSCNGQPTRESPRIT